ncbi:MAG TPA: hypothetical protein VE888_06145 [Streptosporangiaceae bacterium]|jgi:hypothetical protein|nr:hypothetical protein [Streptosporangiaceae bacterium]
MAFTNTCPDDRVVENLAAEMEAVVAARVLGVAVPTADVQPVPSANVLCSCLDLFGVGHFEWGAVAGVPGKFLKTRLDNLEIVDLVTNPPSNLESMLECYLRVVLRLGVLPRLIVPCSRRFTVAVQPEGAVPQVNVDLAGLAAEADRSGNVTGPYAVREGGRRTP